MSTAVISEVTIPLLFDHRNREELDDDKSLHLKLKEADKEITHQRKPNIERPTALSIPVALQPEPSDVVPLHRRNRSADNGRTADCKILEYSEWSPRKFEEKFYSSAKHLKNVPSSIQSNSRMHIAHSPRRKLSESRGVKLPDIAIKSSSSNCDVSKGLPAKRATEKKNKRKQVSYADQTEPGTSEERSSSASPNSPPLTSSPVGYTLRHDGSQMADSSAKTVRQMSSAAPITSLNAAIDIIVFFADNRGFKFSLVGGKETAASSLICLLAEHLDIDVDLLQETCALWMVSDLLEVQLKPHHVPYVVRNNWQILLRRFTNNAIDEISHDEPLLILKRNVRLSVQRELELEDDSEHLTEILYVSAKEEVQRGRYLCDLDTTIQLAALQMAIELGPYDPKEHSVDSMSGEIPEFFPLHYRHSVKTLYLFGFPVIGCKGLENVVLEEYRAVSSKYGSNHEKRKAYLAILRGTPFYGAAFFRGQVERPSAGSIKDIKKMLLAAAMPEIEVFVGINRGYVTVIDPSKHELLLFQSLFECSWRRVDVDPADVITQKRSSLSDIENLPSFLLHFPDDSETMDRWTDMNSGQIKAPEKSKLLQVFSRQAVMMEALMTALYTIAVYEAKEVTDMNADFEAIDNSDTESDTSSGMDEQFDDRKGVGDGQPTEQHINHHRCHVESKHQVGADGDHPSSDESPSPLHKPVSVRSNNGQFGSSQKYEVNSGGHVGFKGYCAINSPTFSPTFFANDFSKLCLATFDAHGKCVSAQGSLRRVLQERDFNQRTSHEEKKRSQMLSSSDVRSMKSKRQRELFVGQTYITLKFMVVG